MDYFRSWSVPLLLILSWAQISLIVASENGSLGFNSGASFVYRTDFETVTRLHGHRLNIGISNWFAFEGERSSRYVGVGDSV